LRCFEDENIIHVDGSVNPLRDKEIIDTELQLKDLDSVEKKLQKVSRAAKTGDKEMVKVENTLLKYKAHLDDGKSVRTLEVTDNEKSMWKTYVYLQLNL